MLFRGPGQKDGDRNRDLCKREQKPEKERERAREAKGKNWMKERESQAGPGLVTQRISHLSDPAAAMSTSRNGNISQHLHGLSGNDTLPIISVLKFWFENIQTGVLHERTVC